MPKPKDKTEEPLSSESSSSISTSSRPSPTSAELEEAKLDVVDRFFPGSKPKKKEEPSDKDKAPEPTREEGKDKPKPEEKPEPKPKKTPPKPDHHPEPPPPILDLTEKGIKESPEPPPPEKKDEKPPEFDPKEQRLLDACEFLEKEDPKYKGLKDSMVAFWAKEQEYISNWEKENPGKTFNADDEDHRQFYSDNEPQVDPDDLENAKIEVRANKIVDLKLKGQNKTLGEENRKNRIQQALQTAQPKITGEVFGAISSLIEQSHPELAKLLKKDEKTGATYLDNESSEKMDEVDPVGKEILMEVAEPLSVVVREIEVMRTLGDDYRANPNNGVRMRRTEGWIFPHAEVLQLLNRVETALKEATEADPESTMRDGKRFTTLQELNTAKGNIENSKATAARKKELIERLDAKYYTIDYDDAIAAAVAEFSDKAKRKLVRLSGVKPKPASEKPPEKEEDKPNPTPKPKGSRPPAISASSDLGDKGSVTTGKHTVDPKELEKKMGWA